MIYRSRFPWNRESRLTSTCISTKKLWVCSHFLNFESFWFVLYVGGKHPATFKQTPKSFFLSFISSGHDGLGSSVGERKPVEICLGILRSPPVLLSKHLVHHCELSVSSARRHWAGAEQPIQYKKLRRYMQSWQDQQPDNSSDLAYNDYQRICVCIWSGRNQKLESSLQVFDHISHKFNAHNDFSWKSQQKFCNLNLKYSLAKLSSFIVNGVFRCIPHESPCE